MAFSRLTVPLDGSPSAAAVLPTVSGLARRLGARVDLLAVVDSDVTELPAFYADVAARSPAQGTTTVLDRGVTHSVEERRLAQASAYLSRVAQSMRARGIEAGHESVAGDPSREIVAAAARNHSDLIAMATHGRSALGRGLLGSVTDRVLHSSSLPMLIVRPEGVDRENRLEPGLNTIIVGLDGSQLAELALEPARWLAAALGAEMVVLRATAAIARVSAYVDEVGMCSEDLIAVLSDTAQAYLNRIVETSASWGIPMRTVVGSGTAADELNRVAAESPGALIVLATRGRSGLTRWVLGSVTSRVIRSARGPVLVVPPVLTG